MYVHQRVHIHLAMKITIEIVDFPIKKWWIFPLKMVISLISWRFFLAILQMEMHNLAAVNAAIAAIDISAGELIFQTGQSSWISPFFHGEIMGK